MAIAKSKITQKQKLKNSTITIKEKPKKTGKSISKNGKKIGRPKLFPHEFKNVVCDFYLSTGEKYTKKFKCMETKEEEFVFSVVDLIQKNRFYHVVLEENPLKITIINTGNIDKIEVRQE